SVGAYQDLQFLRRVILLQQVADARLYHSLFVVGRQDDADARPHAGLALFGRAGREDLAEKPEERRITCIRVQQDRERREEQHDKQALVSHAYILKKSLPAAESVKGRTRIGEYALNPPR